LLMGIHHAFLEAAGHHVVNLTLSV
jgi:hypothetical protein